MTTFTDGPAQGVTLMLKRHARFLRVVRARDGTWDALDQPTDAAKPTETLYAYEYDKDGPRGFACTGSRGGGCYPIGSFHAVLNPPNDATMRDNKEWAKWCEARWRRELKP